MIITNQTLTNIHVAINTAQTACATTNYFITDMMEENIDLSVHRKPQFSSVSQHVVGYSKENISKYQNFTSLSFIQFLSHQSAVSLHYLTTHTSTK